MRVANVTFVSVLALTLSLQVATVGQTRGRAKSDPKTVLDEGSKTLLRLQKENERELNGLLIDAAKHFTSAAKALAPKGTPSEKGPLDQLRNLISVAQKLGAKTDATTISRIAQAVIEVLKTSQNPLVKGTATTGDLSRVLLADAFAIASNLNERYRLGSAVANHLERSSDANSRFAGKQLGAAVYRSGILASRLQKVISNHSGRKNEYFSPTLEQEKRYDLVTQLARSSPKQVRVVLGEFDPEPLIATVKESYGSKINPDWIEALRKQRMLLDQVATGRITGREAYMAQMSVNKYADGTYIPLISSARGSGSIPIPDPGNLVPPAAKSSQRLVDNRISLLGEFYLEEALPDREYSTGEYWGGGKRYTDFARTVSYVVLDTNATPIGTRTLRVDAELFSDAALKDPATNRFEHPSHPVDPAGNRSLAIYKPGTYWIKTNCFGSKAEAVTFKANRKYTLKGPISQFAVNNDQNIAWILWSESEGSGAINGSGLVVCPGAFTIFVADVARLKDRDALAVKGNLYPLHIEHWEQLTLQIGPNEKIVFDARTKAVSRIPLQILTKK